MSTDMYPMPAPAAVVWSGSQVSARAVREHGIRMPFPARQLRSIPVLSTTMCTATANAAKGATNGATKGAQGDSAFEDPV